MEYQPGAAQLVEVIVRQWCEPGPVGVKATEPMDLGGGVQVLPSDSDPESLIAQVIGCMTLKGGSCTWTAGAATPLERAPSGDFSFASGLLPFSAVFTDFRSTRRWVRFEAADDVLGVLLKNNNLFRDTWDYSAYHPKVMQSLSEESVSQWRAKYSIIVALMIRIHFARLLSTDLKAFKRARHEAYHEALIAPLDACRSEMLRYIIASTARMCARAASSRP